MNNLIISEIQIIPLRPSNGFVGLASCSINNQFYIGQIGIYTAPNTSLGYRLTFPTKKLASGKQVPCFYPYVKQAEEIVTKAIVAKYLELMDNFHSVDC